MQRVLTLSRALIVSAALTLVATAAFAQGINLSWNDCGSAGLELKTFACNSNGGAPNILYASIITGVQMDQLNGHAGVIDLQTNAPTLGTWWQFGGCRLSTAISGNFSFVTGPFACLDAWQGAAAGGINVQYQFGGAVNRERIRTVCAIPGSTGITGEDEYYVFSLVINNSKSTGTGACTGCLDGACIVLNSILVTQPAGVGDYTITNPANRNFVEWQASGVNVDGGCPAAVPTKSATWGSVKSLYR